MSTVKIVAKGSAVGKAVWTPSNELQQIMQDLQRTNRGTFNELQQIIELMMDAVFTNFAQAVKTCGQPDKYLEARMALASTIQDASRQLKEISERQ